MHVSVTTANKLKNELNPHKTHDFCVIYHTALRKVIKRLTLNLRIYRMIYFQLLKREHFSSIYTATAPLKKIELNYNEES